MRPSAPGRRAAAGPRRQADKVRMRAHGARARFDRGSRTPTGHRRGRRSRSRAGHERRLPARHRPRRARGEEPRDDHRPGKTGALLAVELGAGCAGALRFSAQQPGKQRVIAVPADRQGRARGIRCRARAPRGCERRPSFPSGHPRARRRGDHRSTYGAGTREPEEVERRAPPRRGTRRPPVRCAPARVRRTPPRARCVAR